MPDLSLKTAKGTHRVQSETGLVKHFPEIFFLLTWEARSACVWERISNGKMAFTSFPLCMMFVKAKEREKRRQGGQSRAKMVCYIVSWKRAAEVARHVSSSLRGAIMRCWHYDIVFQPKALWLKRRTKPPSSKSSITYPRRNSLLANPKEKMNCTDMDSSRVDRITGGLSQKKKSLFAGCKLLKRYRS